MRPLVIAYATLHALAGPGFEAPGTLRAAKLLAPTTLKGAHHTVADEVKSDGHWLEFRVVSDYGTIDARGRTVLATRLLEVDALAKLAEVSKAEVFAKAAGGAVLNVGKGVTSVVKDPAATAQGIGGGVKRFGVNLGRKAKRTADSATADKPADQDKAAEPAPSGTDKAAKAGANAAASVVGVNKSARQWAQKLGVDPYTTNPVLHKALVDVGKIDAAGGIAAKVVVPIPPVVSTTASVGGLVWGKDPEEVRKINEARAAELGTPKDATAAFLRNPHFTITGQTRFLAALAAVKVKGCGDYVAAAAEAANEREALFFVESAELLAGLHEASPAVAVLEDSRALVAKVGDRAVAVLPFDQLLWTEPLQKAATEIAGRARSELGAKTLQARLSGAASPAARKGLEGAGWQVSEGGTAGLSVQPAH
jgi:hypothetical protein